MSDTPKTDELRDKLAGLGWNSHKDNPVADLFVEMDKLERELAEAKEKMLNNPFCSSCQELDCCVSGDGTCAMIRKYLTADETTKQRNTLAEALKSLCKAIISEEPQDITDLLKPAIAATKGGSHDS